MKSQLNEDSSQAKYLYDWNQIRKFPTYTDTLKCTKYNNSNIKVSFFEMGEEFFNIMQIL